MTVIPIGGKDLYKRKNLKTDCSLLASSAPFHIFVYLPGNCKKLDGQVLKQLIRKSQMLWSATNDDFNFVYLFLNVALGSVIIMAADCIESLVFHIHNSHEYC